MNILHILKILYIIYYSFVRTVILKHQKFELTSGIIWRHACFTSANYLLYAWHSHHAYARKSGNWTFDRHNQNLVPYEQIFMWRRCIFIKGVPYHVRKIPMWNLTNSSNGYSPYIIKYLYFLFMGIYIILYEKWNNNMTLCNNYIWRKRYSLT